MKEFLTTLKYIFPKYWANTTLYFIFNIFSTLFGLGSFILLIPFLNVLFGNTEMTTELGTYSNMREGVEMYFNFYLSKIILVYGAKKTLLIISLFFIGTSFFKTSFLYLAKYIMVPVNTGVIRDIRNTLYYKILKLPLSYYTGERKGDIISRMTNDVSEIDASIVRSVETLLKEPIIIIVYMVSLFLLSPQLSLFVLILFPISALIIGKIGSALRKKSILAQTKLGYLISRIEETLGGLRIIKAFNAEKKSHNKFSQINQEFTKLNTQIWRRQDLAVPVSEFLGVSVVVIVMWFGGSLVLSGKGHISSGALITYLAIFSQILPPAKAFANAFYNIQKGLAATARINKIIQAKESIKEKEKALLIKKFTNEIRYNNVSFKYEKDLVINHINLEIKKGQTVALVGQSGSGKSTLVDLLPRFYDVIEGFISIDGIDIKDLKMSDLRKLMGIVNQESILFNDTLFNNIAFGVEKATKKEVEDAAKIANAHDFIMQTPEGYQTNIGDRGTKLSGGQKQRISIARAILANPPILILDEATSALDTESEQLVQESINKLMKNRTSIVIAHRLSTVINADVICVIDNGKIVEKGTHYELLEKKGIYKKLHDIQMFA